MGSTGEAVHGKSICAAAKQKLPFLVMHLVVPPFIHTKVTHPEIDGKPLQLALNRASF
jgi:hypothetical protein